MQTEPENQPLSPVSDEPAEVVSQPQHEPIPVLSPRLANADRILPYLRRIDGERTYSNWGPLVREFEQRLSAHFGVPENCVVSAGSGTAALVGAVLAVAGRATAERPLALLPSFTFTGTASAIEQCGYEAFLADMDAQTWCLDPGRLMAELPPQVLEMIGVAMPVAAFGRAVPQQPWRDFQRLTGIPVVIDGAACFEALSENPAAFVGATPVAVSFHATKSLGTGEGGCVVVTDPDIAARALRALNFGFRGSRDSTCASINGKMSEYHAAVGLAELDGWRDKRGDLLAVAARYREHFEAIGLGERLVLAPQISSSYVIFRCNDERESMSLQATFRQAEIDHRFWYGMGLHRQTYWANSRRGVLTVTDAIASRLIGLPVAPTLTAFEVERVAVAAATAVASPQAQ